MKILKIGIPRALLYFWYGYTWRSFWEQCGLEVVVSPATDRETLLAGAEVSLDELCLPVKIFLGHVRHLAAVSDWVMIPHLVKVENDAYLCPKFMGLPDLVAHTLPEIKEKCFMVTVGPRRTDMLQCLRKAALKIGLAEAEIPRKMIVDRDNRLPAFYELTKYGFRVQDGCEHGLRIGLLGHPYCLYDSCLNLNLLEKLHDYQVDLLTPEMMPTEYHNRGAAKLNKDLFWTMGRFQFDALEWMLCGAGRRVDGFIQVAPFACGPEALIGDLLERRIKKEQLPLMKLHFEEHSGEAGMITRLEAFLDLINYRSRVC